MELSSGDFRIREANMAAYYTSSSNQRDNPIIYSRENLSATYPESQFPQRDNPMMGLHPPASFTDTSAGTSNSVGGFEASDSASQQQNQVLCSLDSSSRMQELQDFSSWRGNSTRNGIMLMNPMTSPTSILQTGQGLSLSLGSQILPGIHQMNQPISFRNNPNPGGSREEQNRTNEFMASGFSGVNRTIPSSKYLKAAQELLDEVVNVKKALRQSQPDHEKNRENSGDRQNTNSKDGFDSNNDSNPRELSGNSSNHMSHGEKQELQSKLTKLLSMLDEVDRRYRQYYHQMQIVVSSFDVIAGVGAAKPYTALALQTISRHFRCLRDAISGQISATRKSLGEQDSLDNKNVGITRLRYVDQKLKQQRALQQLGMTQHHHAWRPQRGLPENSVSILRAWLFEHFLHPYPKDSDKIILARQTGLTRSQVSNWFINARVRLWKPMVEEMYKEEFADAEMDSNSSSENLAAKTTKHDEARSETPSGTPNAGRNPSQQTESKSDHTIPDVETRYSLGPESVIIHHDHSGMVDHRFMASAAAQQYHMEAEMGGRSNVSLTLGLQGSDGDLPEMPGGNRYGFLYQNATEPTGFEYVDPSNQQDRFSSSHLLHDFVA